MHDDIKTDVVSKFKNGVLLHREKIGAISLDVEVGQWRYLTPTDQNYLATSPLLLSTAPEPVK